MWTMVDATWAASNVGSPGGTVPNGSMRLTNHSGKKVQISSLVVGRGLAEGVPIGERRPRLLEAINALYETRKVAS